MNKVNLQNSMKRAMFKMFCSQSRVCVKIMSNDTQKSIEERTNILMRTNIKNFANRFKWSGLSSSVSIAEQGTKMCDLV